MLKYDLLKALLKLSHAVFLMPLVSEFLVFWLCCLSDTQATAKHIRVWNSTRWEVRDTYFENIYIS